MLFDGNEAWKRAIRINLRFDPGGFNKKAKRFHKARPRRFVSQKGIRKINPSRSEILDELQPFLLGFALGFFCYRVFRDGWENFEMRAAKNRRGNDLDQNSGQVGLNRKPLFHRKEWFSWIGGLKKIAFRSVFYFICFALSLSLSFFFFSFILAVLLSISFRCHRKQSSRKKRSRKANPRIRFYRNKTQCIAKKHHVQSNGKPQCRSDRRTEPIFFPFRFREDPCFALFYQRKSSEQFSNNPIAQRDLLAAIFQIDM